MIRPWVHGREKMLEATLTQKPVDAVEEPALTFGHHLAKSICL